MTGIAKVLLGLALGLPVGAYAVGSLVASAADEPPVRTPIILQEPLPPSQGTVPGATVRPSPDPSPSADDSPDDDDDDDDGPDAVVPSYGDLDDDDDDRDDRDDRDDDSGPGSSDDDRDDRDGDDD